MANKIKQFFSGLKDKFCGKPSTPVFGLKDFRDVAAEYGLSNATFKIASRVANICGAENAVQTDLQKEKASTRGAIDFCRKKVDNMQAQIENLIASRKRVEGAIIDYEVVLVDLEGIESIISK